MIQLFQAGKGRFSHNYTMFKDSIVPEYEPGGGGWCYLMLSLGNLYSENQRLQNWWTQSNKGLNLVRYQGVRFKFYRQKFTDYIVMYSNEYPMEVGKYHYASLHPQRLMTYNHRIIVPSMNTQPLNKKTYKSVFIKPPKEFIDKWYFQNHFQRFPLVLIGATACSLQNYYIADNVMSNNVTIHVLNTKIFQRKNFQYPSQTTGYTPKNDIYLYSTPNGTTEITKIQRKSLTYLGNTNPNTDGQPVGQLTTQQYTLTKWGNPFYHQYLNEQRQVFYSTTQPQTLLYKTESTIQSGELQTFDTPLVYKARYNPAKDDGKGNEIYWVSNLTVESGWETKVDPDLYMQGFPLWLMLWGWYDWSKRLGKAQHILNDYTLVIKSSYIQPPLPAYIFLNESFVQGEGPYETPITELAASEQNHWYPRYKFQMEAVENLLMSGTAVCRAENVKQIQAHCFYKFYFKWGGNPASMEQVVDPTAQPSYPLPSGQLFQPEITDPSTSIYNLLYDFDVRRDLITQSAKTRIEKITDFIPSLFTDGTTNPFNPPVQGKETPPENYSTEKEKASKEQQLLQLKQYNQQLLLKLRQLTTNL